MAMDPHSLIAETCQERRRFSPEALAKSMQPDDATSSLNNDRHLRSRQRTATQGGRVYVLEHGHVGREGTSAELGSDDYIRQAYLGVG